MNADEWCDDIDRQKAAAAVRERLAVAEARLAEAVALITIAEGITLTGTGVPALPMAIRERMDAWLRAAGSASEERK